MGYNYAPLWETMKKKSVSKYQLIHKLNFSPSIITRLQHNKSVEMKTINRLCQILRCSINEVVEITLDTPEL